MNLTLFLLSKCAWEQRACLLSLWTAVIFPIIDIEEGRIVKERERKREREYEEEEEEVTNMSAGTEVIAVIYLLTLSTQTLL